MNKCFGIILFCLLQMSMLSNVSANTCDEFTLQQLNTVNASDSYFYIRETAANDRIDFVYNAACDSVTVLINCLSKDTLPSAKDQRKKKIVAALFAFPFPFGFVAAHRVILGTKPWVPIVYVATFGGCFGLLPLVDFFVITFTKHIDYYENNPNIFMWLKD